MDIKMIEKIRNLLNKAGSTDSPAEAEALQERANAMMTKYLIDEAMLEATKPAAARMVPESRHIEVTDGGDPLFEQLADLVTIVARHFRCEAVFYGLTKQRWSTTAMVYGFSSDLDAFDIMYTSLVLTLRGQLEPKPDLTKSFDENVFMMHEAGVKWRRIADLMNRAYSEAPAGSTLAAAWRAAVRVGKNGDESTLVPWHPTSGDGHRLINSYKRHCAAIGELPSVVNPVNYQRNFAMAFAQRISYRFYEMDRVNGVAGTALALRTEDVAAMIKEKHPKMKMRAAKDIRRDWNAQDAGDKAGRSADLGGTRLGRKAGELA